MTSAERCQHCGWDISEHHPRCPYHAGNLREYRDRLETVGEERALTEALLMPQVVRTERLTQEQLARLGELDAYIGGLR